MNPTPDALLAPLLAVDGAHLHALAQQLATRASADGEVDVVHRVVDSPIGPLLLAATPQGLAYLAFEVEGFDAVLQRLSDAIGPRVLRDDAALDEAARELDEYFAGARRTFDVAVDLRLARGFRHDVLEHLRDVGFGSTTTYADLASAAGSPRAVRAVGSACSTNPVPLIVPCHRVLRSDGGVGGYRGGPEAKRWLLALERDAA